MKMKGAHHEKGGGGKRRARERRHTGGDTMTNLPVHHEDATRHDVTKSKGTRRHHEPMACLVGCTKAPYPHSVARLNGALSVVPSFVTVPMRNLLMLFLSR